MISIGCIVFFGVNAFGVVGTTLLSAAKGNGVKMVVQLLTDNRQGIKQLISSSLRIQDPQTISHIKNKIDGFKYREIIDHIIH